LKEALHWGDNGCSKRGILEKECNPGFSVKEYTFRAECFFSNFWLSYFSYQNSVLIITKAAASTQILSELYHGDSIIV
jgi:hypothetical protein